LGRDQATPLEPPRGASFGNHQRMHLTDKINIKTNIRSFSRSQTLISSSYSCISPSPTSYLIIARLRPSVLSQGVFDCMCLSYPFAWEPGELEAKSRHKDRDHQAQIQPISTADCCTWGINSLVAPVSPNISAHPLNQMNANEARPEEEQSAFSCMADWAVLERDILESDVISWRRNC